MRRRAKRILLLCLGLAFISYAAFVLSPWPSALLTRLAFGYGASKTTAALANHVPFGIREQRDIRYGSTEDERLDVYLPPGGRVEAGRPTIVWIHGGAFVAGDRQDVAPYLRILAGRGFATATIQVISSRSPSFASWDRWRSERCRHPEPTCNASPAICFTTAASARRCDWHHFMCRSAKDANRLSRPISITASKPRT